MAEAGRRIVLIAGPTAGGKSALPRIMGPAPERQVRG